jgi:hypothetical protein
LLNKGWVTESVVEAQGGFHGTEEVEQLSRLGLAMAPEPDSGQPRLARRSSQSILVELKVSINDIIKM